MKTFMAILALLVASNFADAAPERYYYGARGRDADIVREGLRNQFGGTIAGPDSYYDSSTGNFGFNAYSNLPDRLNSSPKWEQTGKNIWESDQGTAIIRFGPNTYIASPNPNGYGK